LIPSQQKNNVQTLATTTKVFRVVQVGVEFIGANNKVS